MCMCVREWMYMNHMSIWCQKRPENSVGSPELELQVIVSSGVIARKIMLGQSRSCRWLWAAVCVLGAQLNSSVRAASALNCWTVSPNPALCITHLRFDHCHPHKFIPIFPCTLPSIQLFWSKLWRVGLLLVLFIYVCVLCVSCHSVYLYVCLCACLTVCIALYLCMCCPSVSVCLSVQAWGSPGTVSSAQYSLVHWRGFMGTTFSSFPSVRKLIVAVIDRPSWRKLDTDFIVESFLTFRKWDTGFLFISHP